MSAGQFKAGDVIGYTRILAPLFAEWPGQCNARYRVAITCCGRVAERTYSALTTLKHTGAKRCRACTDAAQRGEALPASQSAREIVLNTREVENLLDTRERQRREMLARVAAKRAQAQAAMDAAHRRAMGGA